MAIANPEKTKRMQQAVAAVLSGDMDHKQAARDFDLHWRSVANAVRRAQQQRRLPGLHPALTIFMEVKHV